MKEQQPDIQAEFRNLQKHSLQEKITIDEQDLGALYLLLAHQLITVEQFNQAKDSELGKRYLMKEHGLLLDW